MESKNFKLSASNRLFRPNFNPFRLSVGRVLGQDLLEVVAVGAPGPSIHHGLHSGRPGTVVEQRQAWQIEIDAERY